MGGLKGAHGGPIAVLTHTFPLYSLTFIARDVEALRRRGLTLLLYSLRRPAAGDVPETMRSLLAETRCLETPGAWRLPGRHLSRLLRRPRGYLAALGTALLAGRLRGRDRLRTLAHFGLAVRILPELEAAGVTHVHAQALSAASSVALFVHRLGGPSYSATAHGHDIFVDPILIREKVDSARFVRVATGFNRRRIFELCGREVPAVTVIPFGVDTEIFSPSPDPPPRDSPPGRELRLLNVGRLVWEKGQHLLLRACAELRRGGIDARLVLVGEGAERAPLERLAAELGLEGRVAMPGALPEGRVAEEYRRADVFVLSSLSEGFGVALLEAMASSLPVVAPRLHGIPEIVTDGVDGRLFPTGSVDDLVAVVRALHADPRGRARMGERGRRTVVERFGAATGAGDLARLLRRASGESS